MPQPAARAHQAKPLPALHARLLDGAEDGAAGASKRGCGGEGDCVGELRRRARVDADVFCKGALRVHANRALALLAVLRQAGLAVVAGVARVEI